MPDQPLAYLITFRCFGTWLHGDDRGSTFWAPGGHIVTPEANPRVEQLSRRRMAASPVTLDQRQRGCVESAIVETAAARGWALHAQNVRTNHVHVVLAGADPPERMLNGLKSYATRYLRQARLMAPDVRPWSRHGSSIYLWSENDVESACTYVIYGQDKADA